MCTVMQVSRLVRWMRLRSVRSVSCTRSRRMASAFLSALVMADLSVLAAFSAAWEGRRRTGGVSAGGILGEN